MSPDSFFDEGSRSLLMRCSRVFRWAIVALLGLLMALTGVTCSKHVAGEDPNAILTSYSWPASTPAAEGLDSALIAQGIDEAATRSYIYSILVVRNGRLVVEYYRPGFAILSTYDVRSITKSIVSALVGAAIERGYVDSVRQHVLDFFPGYDTPTLDSLKRELTIEDLLTMRAGFDFLEDGDASQIYNSYTNWMHESFDLPQKYEPGTHFEYQSPAAHLLSGIVSRSTKRTTHDFAESVIFIPLDAMVDSWDMDPQGYNMGGVGVHITARNLARFGYLYLRKGEIDGRQILSRQWVETSTTPRVELGYSWGEVQNICYGYLWWVGTYRGDSIFMAVGYGGQFVVCDPAGDLVVVLTANPYVDFNQASVQFDGDLGIITRNLLAAAR